jgi:hypothetical protein
MGMASDDFDDLDNEWLSDDEPIVAREDELTAVPYACAACGEPNQTMLDPSGGYHQQYTEDCEVCCRPNLLTITIDPESRVVGIENELEYL